MVSDSTIDRLYHSVLAQYDTVLIGLESVKTMQTVEMIYRRFIELGVDRSTFVLAVGGGIVTDVAGFAASTYMRGLKFGFVSTTLLGQVDASVGRQERRERRRLQEHGRDLHPAAVRHLRSRAAAHAARAGVPGRAGRGGQGGDHRRRRSVRTHRERTTFEALRTDTDLLSDAVSAAIRVKADIVERDERESGDRRKLNLGHRWRMPSRSASNRMNHGEAVAVGTVLIAGAAVKLGALNAGRLRPDRECADGAGLRPDAARGGETPAERGRQGQEKRRRHAADRPAGRDRRLRGAADDDGCLRGVVLSWFRRFRYRGVGCAVDIKNPVGIIRPDFCLFLIKRFRRLSA